MRCGAEVANTVARRMVVQPHRQGGQSQFIEQPVRSSPARDPFSDALDWAGALMSRRSFTRRFHREKGTTVWSWLLERRLALAQRLLETTGHGIDHIAAQAGFGSSVSLRLRFREALKTSPSAYRRTFQGDQISQLSS